MSQKSLVFFIFLLLIFFLLAPFAVQAATLKCDGTDHATLDHRAFVTEFNPTATSGQFVELINTSDYPLSLAGCTLEVYSSTDTLLDTLDLAGTIPQTALLTNDIGSTLYDTAGGKLVWKEGDGTVLYSVSYGTYSGTQANDAGATLPASTQSYQVDGHDSDAWSIASTTTGWCGAVGFGDCPARSAVATLLANGGITTNLADKPDWTKITGLYLEINGKGRIDFLSTMNFTDRYSLSWLPILSQKLDMNTTNQIGLDAEDIKALVDTNATLTMYGVNLNNPTIQVTNTDGSSGDSGIVSGLSYDRSAQTLTFNAAHFTTFKAVETTSSSSSSTSSPPGPPICGDQVPASAPDLFQINTTSKTAKLFFTPISNTSQFYVSFSTKPTAEQHGELVTLHREGVQSHTIYYLKPNTTYYIKVRGQQGCMPGGWSTTMKFKTNSRRYFKY
ncbi:MAG: hypothetical protein WC841_05180 [Candidatus Shapirobacteria bacterium]|jgi:hypothetical protein